MMTASFDIFRMEPEGSVCWLGAAETLEEAKERIRQLAASGEAGFVILDQNTGNRLIVELSLHPSDNRSNPD
jgi:hypothetical protein